MTPGKWTKLTKEDIGEELRPADVACYCLLKNPSAAASRWYQAWPRLERILCSPAAGLDCPELPVTKLLLLVVLCCDPLAVNFLLCLCCAGLLCQCRAARPRQLLWAGDSTAGRARSC